MNNRYELVLLGPEKAARIRAVESKVSDLFKAIGLDFAMDGSLLVGGGTEPDWGGFPVALWFGGTQPSDSSDLQLMRQFLEKGFTLFPVVSTLDDYTKKVPAELVPVNAQTWDPVKTCADVMKGFRLARTTRQVFISYLRRESSGVAHQLFHELNERGFRVFLDTASVDAGVDFQRALWSRMADVDLVVLLDTENALTSTWVHVELNRAHDLGLGVVQLIWPNHRQTSGTELSFPVPLSSGDFENGRYDKYSTLVNAKIGEVIRVVENERIRSLSARRTRLVEGLLEHVGSNGGTLFVHPMKHVDILRGGEKVAEVVPFVGVPDALALYQYESKKTHDPTVVIYDGLGVDVEWIEHLNWLNENGLVKVHQVDDFGTFMGSVV
jgi:hypothetical protein